jgi:hypothetical protein
LFRGTDFDTTVTNNASLQNINHPPARARRSDISAERSRINFAGWTRQCARAMGEEDGSMKLFTTSLFGAAAVALTMGAGSAHAALITGTNLDFETPIPGGLTPNTDHHESANFGTAAVPGWIVNNTSGFGDAGVWAPMAGGVFFNAPATGQGNQVGFLDPASNISQNLNGTLYRQCRHGDGDVAAR